MREILEQEYRQFLATHQDIVIEGKLVKFMRSGNIALLEPEAFQLEKTTVWSFENRGKWATHRGDYRGNWAKLGKRGLYHPAREKEGIKEARKWHIFCFLFPTGSISNSVAGMLWPASLTV